MGGGSNARDEPEVFPRLAFRLNGSEIVFFLFASNRRICVGEKSNKGVEESDKEIMGKVRFFTEITNRFTILNSV